MAPPLIYAHRGASAEAPENTLEAFALAREQGADGVELDVRRTADGAMAVHHDAALADGRLIAATPRADLPPSVPTLAQALDECSGLVVNIEIKNSPYDTDHDPERRLADSVVALLEDRDGRDRVLVSSFDLRTIDRVRALDPALETGFLTFVAPDGAAGIDLAVERGHGAVHPHESDVVATYVARAHAAGLVVNTWTVDDPGRLAGLAGLGVDGVVTNVPAVAREVFRG